MESLPTESEISRKLIQLVKERPFLYDKDMEENRDEVKKMEGWTVIAEALEVTVEEAQNRWTRLRIEFGRHRRKQQAAKASGSQIRDWPLYDLLMWLAPHVKMRGMRKKRKRVHENIQQDRSGYKPILPRPQWYVRTDGGVSVEVNPSIVLQNSHEEITESFIVSPDTADYDDDASVENIAQQHFIGKETGTVKDHSYSSSSHAVDNRIGPLHSPDDSDEDTLFCRSICASLRRFTYHQKALAKIRIQQVMYQVEFDEAGTFSQLQH